MLKYRGNRHARTGLIGVALALLTIAVGLSPERVVQWATTVRYQAVFAEAGGLTAGAPVWMSGTKIGTVSDLALDAGRILATMQIRSSVPLGSETMAHIRTHTLLGSRMVTLESSGSGRMRPNAVIPESRTTSPYSLAEMVGELTSNTAGTDTRSLNDSLDALSTTLDQIAPELGPTFEGLSGLSKSLNARNETLRQLLAGAADVTGVLAQRSEDLNTLIVDANALVGVLNDRREAIVTLLVGVTNLSKQLTGIAADNEKDLAPTLNRLNSVTRVLEENRDNIAKALPGLAKYQMTQAEAVATGPYFQAYVQNLIPGTFLQPFLDYAFGFRRGVNAGRPPDNAGPRAEFPFPRNGIPGGSR